jgi:putative molybdopterin biosynthesis protein
MTTRVRARREQIKLPQRDLAALAGISRQALSSIEAGRSAPSVDLALRLARALGVTVEELWAEDDGWQVRAEDASTETGRRIVANIRGKWVAHGLEGREHDVTADGLAVDGGLRLFRPPEVAQQNILIMGCAPVLGVLCDRLNSERGPGRFVWLPRTSKAGATALAAGSTHVAGMHLTDERGAEANASYVKTHVPSQAITLVTLAHWEVGLVVGKGNPKRIRRGSDVAQRRVRLVNRERDASPRRVLERRLRAEGTAQPNAISTVRGHRELARTVASGAADVGPSVRDAAVAFGLDFVPFQEERFDLAIPTDMIGTAEIRRLVDLLATSRMRTELAALGYDVRSSGSRTEIRA